MKKRRRISLRESISGAMSAESGTGAEGATFFTAIWYWIVGVPLADNEEKLPEVDPGFIEIVPWLPVAQADAAFDEWLKMTGLTPSGVAPDLRISTGRGKTGDLRRYLIRRGSESDKSA